MSCCDACEGCGKQFKERHYSWFVCIDCHNEMTPKSAISLADQNEMIDLKFRLANKEELE